MVDGRLQVTGRIDTVIDSGGLKLHPEVVESAMLGISGVKAACVVGVPHPRLGQAVVAVYVGPASPGQVIAGLSGASTLAAPQGTKASRCPAPHRPRQGGSPRSAAPVLVFAFAGGNQCGDVFVGVDPPYLLIVAPP